MTDDAGAARLHRLFADDSAFFARFQPLVDLQSGHVVAQAASLHARTGSREQTPTDLFTAARDTDSVARLDRLGREVAIRDASGWLGGQRLLVRVVAEMIAQPQLALDGLDIAARSAGVPMRQIVVEVQLTAGVDAFAHLARVITRCRGTGCRVAVADAPDAATIRASVSMLAPDYIKLGRSLVSAPEADLRAAVEAGHAAQSTVIAFGVESDQQRDLARTCGADWGQGWAFGRPELPPSASP